MAALMGFFQAPSRGAGFCAKSREETLVGWCRDLVRSYTENRCYGCLSMRGDELVAWLISSRVSVLWGKKNDSYLGKHF